MYNDDVMSRMLSSGFRLNLTSLFQNTSAYIVHFLSPQPLNDLRFGLIQANNCLCIL